MKKINEVKILIFAAFISIVLVGATIASRVEAAQGGTEPYEVLTIGRFSNEIDNEEVTTGVDWDYRVYGPGDAHYGQYGDGDIHRPPVDLFRTPFKHHDIFTTPGHNYVDIDDLHRPPVAPPASTGGGTGNLYEE